MFNAAEMNTLANNVVMGAESSDFNEVFDLIKEGIETDAGLGAFTTSFRADHFPNELDDYFYNHIDKFVNALEKFGFEAYRAADVDWFLFVSWKNRS